MSAKRCGAPGFRQTAPPGRWRPGPASRPPAPIALPTPSARFWRQPSRPAARRSAITSGPMASSATSSTRSRSMIARASRARERTAASFAASSIPAARPSIVPSASVEMKPMAYDNILVEQRGRVGLVTLNRPKALNALNDALVGELLAALAAADADDGIGASVITGSEKAFAAGADIREMAGLSAVEAYGRDQAAAIGRLAEIRKPVIAAVAGYCLGGGAELAMLCDFIIAADTAKFGQPEITLGIMPGMGGTQRLPRLVGKSLAMDMILTGRQI